MTKRAGCLLLHLRRLALQQSQHLQQRVGAASKRVRRLALRSLDSIRSMDPAYAERLFGRGNILADANRFEEARIYYDRGLKIAPDNVLALYRRSVIWRRMRRSERALMDLDRALTLRPDFAEALIGRAMILRLLGDIGQALASLRKAIALKPDDAGLHTTYIFTLNFDHSVSEADKQHERTEWERRHARKFRSHWQPHDNDPAPGRRLRIGYVSSHLRYDNSTYSFGEVILNHDADRFETFCYSDTLHEDDATAILRERVDHWHRTRDLSDDQLSELIRSDRIDILIDCLGHMAGNRLLVFARKPAPVQVTAWGEVTGTGLKAVDYLLASPVLIPESDRGLFTERVIDLPNFSGYWSPDLLPDVGPLPAIGQGYVTFGSFSRLPKIVDPTIRCWAEILRKLPRARLVLKHPHLAETAFRARIATAFESYGVSPAALLFLGGTDRQTHFSCYNMIDIALDTFPHSGGMTTLDAVWMGVPVISWPGKSVSSRWAATTLVPLGLSEFLADSEEDYVELAVAKAADTESLAQLRANLRARMAASEFGDGPRFCRAVEASYVEMWSRWCRDHSSRGANGHCSVRP
ncbi:MAG: tetratricopeptide repeat protein [Alphaproteobacteria bacterium]